MYGYIYMTENLTNHMKYIGQHKATAFDEKYKGSGKILRRAISKYGKDNFQVQLIESCENAEVLDEREKYWISYYKADQNKNFYNICQGGLTRREMSGENNPMYGKHHTQEVKDFISQNNTGQRRSQEWIDDYRKKHPNWNGTPHTQEFKDKLSKRMSGENNPMYGKTNKGYSPTKKRKRRT